jgi:hypothetical protein
VRSAILASLLGAAALAQIPAAAAEPVDVELVLAADGSGSIDDDELAFQRRGYADAITSPEVLNAIRAGALGAIAVTYVEWGGPTSQHTIVDWAVIRDAASAEAFARALVERPREARGYNSISAAIDYAMFKLETNTQEGVKRVIDVSGDGPNIGGRRVTDARDEAVSKGVVINALVIQRPGGRVDPPGGIPLIEHYRRDVIGGPAAFVMVVDEDLSFTDAVRRKMVLEIASLPAPAEQAASAGTLQALSQPEPGASPGAKAR